MVVLCADHEEICPPGRYGTQSTEIPFFILPEIIIGPVSLALDWCLPGRSHW